MHFRLFQEVIPVRRLDRDVKHIAAAREGEGHLDSGRAEPPHGPEKLRKPLHG